ncbi:MULTISPECIES: hypothetical protein [unclassified Campylobacter]
MARALRLYKCAKNTSRLHKHHLKIVYNQNLRQVYNLARFKK